MSTEHPIDPALLDQPTTGGRGTKRKAQGSVSALETGNTRSSTRLAGKITSSASAEVGLGVGGQAGRTAGEPSRGEEENLIGSEYKLRGKRPRGSKGKSKSVSKSPVKQRTSLPSNDQAKGKGKGKEKANENDQASVNKLEDAAPITIPIPLLYRPPYPIMTRPFIYPCLNPGQLTPPAGDPNKPFKRFDPREFDDPNSLLDDTESLSSDDDDEAGAPVKEGKARDKAGGDGPEPGPGGEVGYTGTDTDGPFGVGMGGELEYDTQAYQSLAALLEASNDDLFHQGGQ